MCNFNPFQAKCSTSIPPENDRKTLFFREYRHVTLAWNWLKKNGKKFHNLTQGSFLQSIVIYNFRNWKCVCDFFLRQKDRRWYHCEIVSVGLMRSPFSTFLSVKPTLLQKLCWFGKKLLSFKIPWWEKKHVPKDKHVNLFFIILSNTDFKYLFNF